MEKKVENSPYTILQNIFESKQQILTDGEYVVQAMKEYADIRNAKLTAFKTYVHDRLDKMGVPSDPEPENNAAHGCRIEGRLNHVQNIIDGVNSQNEREIKLMENIGVANRTIELLQKENANELLDALDLKRGSGPTVLRILMNRVNELETVLTRAKGALDMEGGNDDLVEEITEILNVNKTNPPLE